MTKKIAFIALCALSLTGAAYAETADREKPIEITAQDFHGDEVNQTAVYTGNVEVHQGTLEILGARLELTVSPEGYRTITVTGNPVRMKEKRDTKTQGIEEWVHASSLKAVYDESKDVVTFQDVAKLARSENGLVKDSTAGDKIIYDLRTARSRVEGAVSTEGKRSRVSTVLAPRANQQKAPTPARNDATAPMSGSTRLGQ
ncbi:MAG: lipopolysaccharide transport periplasmic protein LptA [Sutterellaceae bacterium]|nr:lipopolysaccharide transport periplasmic protein LptA [Sutterellaceae bacterium]